MGLDANTTKFVEVFVSHVPFDGWSEASMKLTVAELEIEQSEVDLMFPEGVKDVFLAYSKLLDEKMVRETKIDSSMRVHVRIRTLALCRLRAELTNKELVNRSLLFLAQPINYQLGAKSIYETVDTMWRLAGDRSTDVNFYTKRATLASIYGATLLASLSHKFTDFKQTEDFFDRRLKDISYFSKSKKPIEKLTQFSSKFLTRAFLFHQR